MRRRIRRFLDHRLALLSGLVLAFLCGLALCAPLIADMLGTDGVTADLFNRLAPSSASNPLGTDEAGRDVLVRLLYGGRVSLAVALVTAIITAVIGAAVGLAAGYFGGPLDSLLMRLTDGVIALPLLPLLIVLAAVDLTKLGFTPETASGQNANLYRIVVIIALVGWTTVARLVRAEALSLRRRDFVRAAIAQGAGPARILFVHILPNCASPLVVATTLSIGNIILFESVLSFLGLGIQPPTPSWGNMLTNAQDIIWDSPLLAIWPGTLIFVTVIAFNFLGDGLQDALDPKALSNR
ncbi:ABC transporter permease [Hwanghaeella grinnelliae]|uniref:ABC transporter permease n=2 Tax=Hwanghaeella grinnelliae TaxID=2500179 RepID=A0A3S2VTU7_9PROT|nr:ABC transporter permease [Hwanghaeella grinnelliae]